MQSGFVSKPLPCLNRHPSAPEKSIVCLFATPANLAILAFLQLIKVLNYILKNIYYEF